MTFLAGLSDPFRGEVTSIWVTKRSLGRRKLDAPEEKLGSGSSNILQQEKHVSNIREEKTTFLQSLKLRNRSNKKHWGLVQIRVSFWDMFGLLVGGSC